MKYIIGNWKAYKTYPEAKEWMNQFKSHLQKKKDIQSMLENQKRSIIICPPYPYLSYFFEETENMPYVHIGSQDVSLCNIGKHTGEVPAGIIQSMASYAIIGHSERRSIQIETDDEIETKLSEAKAHNIEPVLCVRGKSDTLFDFVRFVAYEPVEAIGTGNSTPVSDVVDVKNQLLLPSEAVFLYGGSVTRDNCGEYLSSSEIDGLLIGSASLDPEHFLDIAAYEENI